MPIRATAVTGICCIAGALLAGCGGSSSASHPSLTASAHGRETPLMSNPDTGGTKQQSSHPAAALGQLRPARAHSTVKAATSRLTPTKVAKARPTPATSHDDNSATGPQPPNPCRLVSLSEAQTITGGAITKLTEAPLGPTCIYMARDSSAGVTLAIETENVGQVTRHMTGRKQLVIGGHRSVCGRLGTPVLFVPLGRYQLLNVTAPCGIAKRFATLAMGRLTA